MATIYTEVGVDVNIENFETSDLIEELESRGYGISESLLFLEIEDKHEIYDLLDILYEKKDNKYRDIIERLERMR